MQNIKYPHESEKLNKLLGKVVKITLFDKTTLVGVLEKSTPPHTTGYCIGFTHFKKSHVIKIEV